MTLKEYIKEQRLSRGYSRNKLATLSGVSHTEIRRIEEGERTKPSADNLKKIADALHLPASILLVKAGYMAPGEVPVADIKVPGVFTEKQIEATSKFIDGLSRNAELSDEDLDELSKQVDMFLNYARNKKTAK